MGQSYMKQSGTVTTDISYPKGTYREKFLLMQPNVAYGRSYPEGGVRGLSFTPRYVMIGNLHTEGDRHYRSCVWNGEVKNQSPSDTTVPKIYPDGFTLITNGKEALAADFLEWVAIE